MSQQALCAKQHDHLFALKRKRPNLTGVAGGVRGGREKKRMNKEKKKEKCWTRHASNTLTCLHCWSEIQVYPNQNGISLLYIMLVIHHSGWESSISTHKEKKKKKEMNKEKKRRKTVGLDTQIIPQCACTAGADTNLTYLHVKKKKKDEERNTTE